MKQLLSFMFFLFSAISFLQADIYDDFYSLKVKLYNTKEQEAISSSILEFKNGAESASDEEKLTLQNLLILEETNRLNKKKDAKKIYKLLKAQDKASQSFMKNKKNVEFGKWFLLSLGDIKSRLVSYVQGLDAYNMSTIARQYYKDALAKDNNFSPAYVSDALWLLFAPPIAGGGYENALNEFNLAVSSAKSNEEKYVSLIFRSQVHFKLGNIKEWQNDLEMASSLIKGETFTQYIMKLNNETKKIFF